MRSPHLVLLPGLDGIGKRFTRFIQAVDGAIEVEIVRYPADEILGYAELEGRVRAVLPRGKRFVLLAESFSGPLGIRIAATPPPGLVGLILCSSFARFPLRCPSWALPLAVRMPLKSLPRWLRALLMWGSFDPRRAPAAADRSMANVSAAVIRHRIGELLRVDERTRLPGVKMPVLIVRGRRDRLISGANARALTRAAIQGELVELEGPHALLQSRPEACATTILQFVQQWI